jgi:hypothetical protein
MPLRFDLGPPCQGQQLRVGDRLGQYGWPQHRLVSKRAEITQVGLGRLRMPGPYVTYQPLTNRRLPVNLQYCRLSCTTKANEAANGFDKGSGNAAP